MVVRYTADRYDVRYLHRRNTDMIRAADVVVAVHDKRKTSGAAASAVNTAVKAGRTIVHIDPATRTVHVRPGTTETVVPRRYGLWP